MEIKMQKLELLSVKKKNPKQDSNPKWNEKDVS